MAPQVRSVLALLAGLMVGASQASSEAQWCLVMEPEALLDTTDTCMNMPEVERQLKATVQAWNGAEFLVADVGNEIRCWDLEDPSAPIAMATSDFQVPPLGDTDYNIDAISVCDDCRWGAATYRSGLVLFDLGAGTVPTIMDMAWHPLPTSGLRGNTVFSYDGAQYLVGTDLSGGCPDGQATLFEISGVTAQDLDPIACIEAMDQPVDGVLEIFFVPSDDEAFVYLGDDQFRVHVYRISNSGSAIALEYIDTPFPPVVLANGARGMAVDSDAMVAVTGGPSGTQLWDISAPGQPVSLAIIDDAAVDRVAVHHPLVWTARAIERNSIHLFDITQPSTPVELDPGFWDPSLPWNLPDVACVWERSAVFSRDGSALYLSRFSVGQVVDVSSCVSALIWADDFEDGDV